MCLFGCCTEKSQECYGAKGTKHEVIPHAYFPVKNPSERDYSQSNRQHFAQKVSVEEISATEFEQCIIPPLLTLVYISKFYTKKHHIEYMDTYMKY